MYMHIKYLYLIQDLPSKYTIVNIRTDVYYLRKFFADINHTIILHVPPAAGSWWNVSVGGSARSITHGPTVDALFTDLQQEQLRDTLDKNAQLRQVVRVAEASTQDTHLAKSSKFRSSDLSETIFSDCPTPNQFV